jgi:tRNA-specific 2-thiouridylase
LGRTPNPCIDCNRFLKFDALLSRALALGFERLATGHYAGIKHADGTYLLTRPKDRKKDQTYFLAGISRAALGSILFPLQSLTKDEVRAIAKTPASRWPKGRESGHLFVPNGDCGFFVAHARE